MRRNFACQRYLKVAHMKRRGNVIESGWTKKTVTQGRGMYADMEALIEGLAHSVIGRSCCVGFLESNCLVFWQTLPIEVMREIKEGLQ